MPSRAHDLVELKPETLQFYHALTQYVIFPKATLLWGHSPKLESVILSRTLCSRTSISLSNDNYQFFFRFVNCAHSWCCYNKNSAKKWHKIFQHASPITRQNILNCFLSARTTWNILQSTKIKSPIKLTSVKQKLNSLEHIKKDIEINNTTKLQVTENALFLYLISVDSILTKKF